jgi:hypothetical protein
MAEFLGLGLSHYPGFLYPDDRMSGRIKQVLSSKQVPAELRDVSNWPLPMRREWSDDEGLSFAKKHRAEFVDGVRRLRSALDDFRPDAVVIFGDDQYENFKEDIVPPFCVFIRDEFKTQPFIHGRFGYPEPNVWGIADDAVISTPGAPAVARTIATNLSKSGIPISYSYAGHHLAGLGHAFINTVLYLDYDQRGWDLPTVPIHVNAYGSEVVRNRGEVAHLFSEATDLPEPPAPSPRVAFELGQRLVGALNDTPWRIAVVGSSSWSHAFLTKKHSYLYPDVDADRLRFSQMQAGDYDALSRASGAELESSGQHELLNWMPLFGAMAQLKQKPVWSTLIESYTMNSSKAMVLYAPVRT